MSYVISVRIVPVTLCVRVVRIYHEGVYLFFFKQKTAYEMRISDWSSDVCSSDLFARAELGQILALGGEHAHFIDQMHTAGGHHQYLEIGRASCRERVCQYV